MSLKHAVQRVGANHYVLPKLGPMRVEAHAFLSEELYERSEAELWSQIKHAASYEGVIGAYLMPDAHLGYGVPVGSVVVTDTTVIQAGTSSSCKSTATPGHGIARSGAHRSLGQAHPVHERPRDGRQAQ